MAQAETRGPPNGCSRGRGVGILVAVIVGLVALVAVGSWLYWVGEGRPGTAAGFRERVAETGLEVDWTNNGPRGGEGVVQTDCGPQPVNIQSLHDDDTVRLVLDDGWIELTPDIAAAVQGCRDF